MSESTPGTRGVLIGRLTAPPTVDTPPGGGVVATLRVTVRDTEEYVIVAFGRRAHGLAGLAAGRRIYAEGCWQACEGRPPELIADTITPFRADRSTG